MSTRQCFALPGGFNLLCTWLHTEKGLKVEPAHLECGQGESEIWVVFFCQYVSKPPREGQEMAKC